MVAALTTTTGGQPIPILEFPTDIGMRRKWFINDSFEHPAKLHLGLLQWLIDRYTLPGETICDPMAGVGSILMAAALARNVIAREIEPGWLSLMEKNAVRIREQAGLFPGAMDIAQHNARLPWGYVADQIITSPPYACAFSPNPDSRRLILDRKLRTLEKAKYSERWMRLAVRVTAGAAGSFTFSYGNHPDNIGHFRGARYWQAMTEIYTNAFAALRPGPNHYLILVIKDHIKKRRRVPVADQTVELCEGIGFQLHERYQRQLPGLSLWQRRRKEQGEPVIEQEDILVFCRRENT